MHWFLGCPCFMSWKWLPETFRSLAPYDRQLCGRCSCCNPNVVEDEVSLSDVNAEITEQPGKSNEAFANYEEKNEEQKPDHSNKSSAKGSKNGSVKGSVKEESSDEESDEL